MDNQTLIMSLPIHLFTNPWKDKNLEKHVRLFQMPLSSLRKRDEDPSKLRSYSPHNGRESYLKRYIQCKE